jgi:predicted nucleic acid-binding protein
VVALGELRAVFLALPVDDQVADAYGTVLAPARAAGRTVKATDLLIVATALVTQRVLHTRDHAQAGVAQLAGVAVARP